MLMRTLAGYISHAIKEFPVDPQTIYELVVVGNATMRDLFFRQNVHSIVQIIASGASRGSRRLQFSHVGRSSSIVASWQRAAAQRRFHAMGARGIAPAAFGAGN